MGESDVAPEKEAEPDARGEHEVDTETDVEGVAVVDEDSEAVDDAVAVLRLDTVCEKVNWSVCSAVSMDVDDEEDDPDSELMADVETVAVGDPE